MKGLLLTFLFIFFSTSFAQESVEELKSIMSINEKVKSIAFDGAFTRGGRGDVAPALNAAKTLRDQGYTGEITIYVNDQAGNSVLRELDPEYRQLSNNYDVEIKLKNNIRVVKTYKRYGKSPELKKILESSNHDVAFRLALRPSEIRRGKQIRGAKYSFHAGVFNLEKINGNSGAFNKLFIDNVGEIKLPDIGPGSNDLGIYLNKFAQILGRSSMDEKLMGLQSSLENDNKIYKQILWEHPDYDYIKQLKERNEKLLNMDMQNKKIATIYGFGLRETWNDFGDYIKTVGSAKANSGTILISPSVIVNDREKIRDHLTVPSKYNNHKQFIEKDKIKIVDLMAGENIPKKIGKGEVVILMTGNLPHQTYQHFSAISNLPNLVAGDNAVSDMISMGKPFVMTSVDWNKPSIRNIKNWIEKNPKYKFLAEAFNLEDPNRLEKVSKFLENEKEVKELFKAMSKEARNADVIHNLLSVSLDPENYQKNIKKKSGETDLDLKVKNAYDSAYIEQKQNIKHIYKKGVFNSELQEKFKAENKAKFKLSYYLIPADADSMNIEKSKYISPEIQNFYLTEKDGKKYIRLLVHPEAEGYYKEKLKDIRGAEYIHSSKSSIYATPTATERTLIINTLDDPDVPNHRVKTTLPLTINNSERSVWNYEVKRSVRMTDEVLDIVKSSKNKKLTGVLPETFGIWNENMGGMIVREMPKSKKGHKWMPVFGLLGEDPVTHKPHFFSYMSKAERENPELALKWLEKNIMNPILDTVKNWSLDEGILFEMHSQNLMVEVDSEGKKLTGNFKNQDLGGALYDVNRRTSLGKDLYTKGMTSLDLKLSYKDHQIGVARDFVKKQIFDLFAIQMKSHGLISVDEREAFKKHGEAKLKDLYLKELGVNKSDLSWGEIFKLLEKKNLELIQKRGTLEEYSPDFKDNKVSLYDEESRVKYRAVSSSSDISLLLDKNKELVGLESFPGFGNEENKVGIVKRAATGGARCLSKALKKFIKFSSPAMNH